MNNCPACGGVIGRDCWNPQECAAITAQMQFEPPPVDLGQGDRLAGEVKLMNEPITDEAVERLIERLRYVAEVLSPGNPNMIHLEAADTLQAVRGENERLREALTPFASAWDRFDANQPYSTAPYLFVVRADFKRARQALSAIQNGGGEGGLSQSQPSGAGPSDLAGHDQQHSGGGRDVS